MPSFAAIVPQAMIAIIVEVIAGMVSASAATMPWPTVVATAVPDIAPSVFSTIAMAIAERGVMTPVETTVAMALGASVQPFTNSATSTCKEGDDDARRQSLHSRLLAGERQDMSRDVVGVVGHFLEQVEELMPGDEADRVGAGAAVFLDQHALDR